MKNDIDKAIETLSKKINKETTSGNALKFTQAVLNLANAKSTLKHTEKIK